MDKIKFWIFCLVAALVVQHVQLENIKNKERENWRQFRVFMDAQEAHAVVPIALAAAAPYVLASLVAGTTAVWCYTHGGKEAWIQFTGAVNNGVDVTKAWIQEKIAENNNIDTAGDDLDGDDGSMTHNGNTLTLSSLQGEYIYAGQYQVGKPPVYYEIPTWGAPIYQLTYGTGVGSTRVYKRSTASGDSYYYKSYIVYSVSPAAGFDPDDYPELYTGPALNSNCHTLAKQYPALSLVYAPPTATAPPYDPTKKIQVPVAARLADGSLVDQSGRKLPPPPPGVVPGLIDPPLLDPDVPTIPIETPASDLPNYVDPELAGAVGNDLKDFFAPVDLANDLINVGITGPISGIRDIAGQKHLVWKDTAGVTHVTPVSAAIAAQIAPMLPAAAVQTGTGTSIDPNEPEQDPGDPDDVVWGFGNGTFDPSFDWGSNSTFDVQKHVGIVKNLPFVSLVEGSTFTITGPQSVITVDFDNFPGVGPTSIEFDFANFEWLYDLMGRIIYFFAMIHSIALAFHLKVGGA